MSTEVETSLTVRTLNLLTSLDAQQINSERFLDRWE